MNNAYITLLSTNNYLYGCIGLMYSWKKTNSKYPFYVIVTEDITEENIRILKDIGYQVIVDKLYIPQSYFNLLKEYEETGEYEAPTGNSTADLTKNGWQYGWTKLHMFKYTQFDKLLFIDADSYIVHNLDYLFDMPAWSSVCEYDAPWRNKVRFMSAFLLVEPNIQTYNELLQLAEDNPLIQHPATWEYQLSNDYDLLNLYKNDWDKHPEYIMPNYTYIDSLCISTADFFLPFLINNFYKIGAIHLTGEQPWIAGIGHVNNYCVDWCLWKEVYLIYIKFLNNCLKDMFYNGITSLPMVK